jgi:hypothetical protein
LQIIWKSSGMDAWLLNLRSTEKYSFLFWAKSMKYSIGSRIKANTSWNEQTRVEIQASASLVTN